MTTADERRTDDAIAYDYDHYDPAFAFDPHDTWAEMREQCPVARTERYGGFYVLTRMADISRAVHETDAFSSFPADTPPDPQHQTRLIPMEIDPPEHRHYRRLLEPLFRPKLMAEIEPDLRADAAALADAMVQQNEFDFIAAFAAPFPITAFVRLLGLPADDELDRPPLVEWVNQILHTDGVSHDDPAAQAAARRTAGRALQAYLRDAVDVAVRTDRPGLITTLARPADPAKGLSERELLNLLHVLVLGGLETVTTALAFAFLHLGARPDLQEQLRTDPSLVPSAVEEFLRYDSAVHPSRTVTAECTFAGVTLVPGDRVALPLGSANRDADAFDRPDEIVLDREANRHVAFGAGDHRCLGSHLARLELRIALQEVLHRLPRFQVVGADSIQAHGGQTRSITTLPLRVVPDGS